MKLLQLYSLATGLKIDKPFIYTAFYPLPFEKYITIHASAGMPSKMYSFWEDVLEIIRPTLVKEKIRVVQIGGPEDEKLDGCFHLQGITNIHQSSFILSKSICHLCNDTFSAHVAGAFDIPLVSIYGSTTVKNHSPYFFNEAATTFIEADRRGFNPSYAREEKPKMIDNIKPEEIANGLLRLFDVSSKRESLHFGNFYPTHIVEVIPDYVMPPDYLANGVVNVRMDYHFDEKNLANIMQGRKVNILTDKPIGIKILRAFKSRINTFSYEVTESTHPAYIRLVKSIGLELNLFTKESDKQKLDALRLKLFEFEIAQESIVKKEEFDFLPKLSDNTLFKSNKFILSKDGIFLSKAGWLNKSSIKSFQDNIQTVIDSDIFWEEAEHFYLFNQ